MSEIDQTPVTPVTPVSPADPAAPVDLGPAASVPADPEPTDTTSASASGPQPGSPYLPEATNDQVLEAIDALPDKIAAAMAAALANQAAAVSAPAADDTIPAPAGPASPTVSTDPAPAPPIVIPPAPETPEATNDVAFKVGEVVRHEYRDDYQGAGGLDVVDLGMVLDIVPVDLGNGESENRVRVGWFHDISDPIPDSALKSAG